MAERAVPTARRLGVTRTAVPSSLPRGDGHRAPACVAGPHGRTEGIRERSGTWGTPTSLRSRRTADTGAPGPPGAPAAGTPCRTSLRGARLPPRDRGGGGAARSPAPPSRSRSPSSCSPSSPRCASTASRSSRASTRRPRRRRSCSRPSSASGTTPPTSVRSSSRCSPVRSTWCTGSSARSCAWRTTPATAGWRCSSPSATLAGCTSVVDDSVARGASCSSPPRPRSWPSTCWRRPSSCGASANVRAPRCATC